MPEINAAIRKGAQECPDTCQVMSCCRCGAEVLVNRLASPNLKVHCMECVKVLAVGTECEWRFPYDN